MKKRLLQKRSLQRHKINNTFSKRFVSGMNFRSLEANLFQITKKEISELPVYVAEGLYDRKEEKKMSDCKHFGMCGGCAYRDMPYDEQLKMKEETVRELLKDYIDDDCIWDGIKASPIIDGYRNKMEFSFGDAKKDGDLELGMHRRGSFYDIVSVTDCKIVDEDYRKILAETLSYFREKDVSYFHRKAHTGYLRHLLVRKGKKTGEILQISQLILCAWRKDYLRTMLTGF